MTENVKYEFSPTELKLIADDTGQALAELTDARENKKVITKSLQEGIDALETRIFANGKRLREGYEMRPVECIAIMDTPKVGMKQIIIGATSEVVRIEPMTPEERQTKLFETDRPEGHGYGGESRA